MPLSVQNQIPCAGGFGCQRIHVILNKHDDKLDGLEEICFMEKLITRKEAAEILGISIATPVSYTHLTLPTTSRV